MTLKNLKELLKNKLLPYYMDEYNAINCLIEDNNLKSALMILKLAIEFYDIKFSKEEEKIIELLDKDFKKDRNER